MENPRFTSLTSYTPLPTNHLEEIITFSRVSAVTLESELGLQDKVVLVDIDCIDVAQVETSTVARRQDGSV
jgi:hypothetical protein